MIRNDEEMLLAQLCVSNLRRVLLEARKVHSQADYTRMAEPILLEIQQREQEIRPGAIRRKLGLRPGDALDASVKCGQIVLTPRHSRRAKAGVRAGRGNGSAGAECGAGGSSANQRAGSGYAVRPGVRHPLEGNAMVATGFLEYEFHGRAPLWVRRPPGFRIG